MSLFVTVSGHGLGHAMRTAQVLAHVRSAQPGLPLAIVGTPPRWVFEVIPGPAPSFHHLPLDAGVVEAGLFDQDIPATLAQADALSARRPELIAQGAALARDSGARLLLADAPPLAAPIARAAGIPSVFVANFGWDFIYGSWGASELSRQAAADYAQATLLLQLPMSEPMPAFPRRQAVPLIARRASAPADAVRAALDLPPPGQGDPVLILMWRHPAVGAEAFARAAQQFPAHYLAAQPMPFAHPRLRELTPEWRARFADVLGASDGIVTKPGYGVCADAIANATPMLLLPRRDFPEVPHLTAELARCGVPHSHIAETDFVSGAWGNGLSALLAKSRTRPTAPREPEGAAAVAGILLQMLQHPRNS